MGNDVNRGDKLLELDDISFGYPGGELILSGLTTSLSSSEIVCVIGQSGCGKTTLLNIAGGFILPSSGTVRFNGADNHPPDIKRVMVFQDGNQLFPWLRTEGNVMFPMSFAEGGNKMSSDERRESAGRLLSLVGLSDAADFYPATLSGGMKQRAVIARALATRPELLLLDEPFTALDAPTRRSLQNMLLELRDELGVSMLFVTHDIREAVYLSDRLLIMTPGGTISMQVDLCKERDEFSDEFVKVEREVYRLISPDKS